MGIYQFNEKKTTQAAAYLTLKHGGQLNYTKLIKLLYLSDREALSRWNRTITGDKYVSMGKGPVLSRTYDLINYAPDPQFKSFWYEIMEKQAYDVSVKANPGVAELSRAEIEILDQIFEEYKNNDWRQMIRICHDKCHEWKDPGDTSAPISHRTILRALNKGEEEIQEVEEEADNIEFARTILPPAD